MEIDEKSFEVHDMIFAGMNIFKNDSRFSLIDFAGFEGSKII